MFSNVCTKHTPIGVAHRYHAVHEEKRQKVSFHITVKNTLAYAALLRANLFYFPLLVMLLSLRGRFEINGKFSIAQK